MSLAEIALGAWIILSICIFFFFRLRKPKNHLGDCNCFTVHLFGFAQVQGYGIKMCVISYKIANCVL